MIRFLQGVVVLLVFAGLWLALLVGLSRAPAEEPRRSVLVEMPDLDALEARMVQAAEITRRWEELAERSREATPVVCEQMAGVAMTWEVR